MRLDGECKGCLYKSQLKKVEGTQTDGVKVEKFKDGVKALCENPPEDYCAPLLMRDIDLLHRKIFGIGLDYSKEKSFFNKTLLSMEDELYSRIIASIDPIKEGLKFAMTSNYIDFARLSNLDGESVKLVISASERASVDSPTLDKFKSKLKTENSLLYLHDNCGEIVLDKILIRVIKKLYPHISVTSVVRGYPIINDVTEADAEEVGLSSVSKVIANGAGVPGTFLKEVSPEVIRLLKQSGVVISKGLGNLETLYGEGFSIFYAFNCKCSHIAEQFALPLWSAAFIYSEQ